MFKIEIHSNKLDMMDTEAFLDNISFDRGETFFKRASTSIMDVLSIRQYLENRMVSGLAKELVKLERNNNKYLDSDWSKIVMEDIPITVGFNTNIFMLSEMLADKTLETFESYKVFYKRIDSELNSFIGDKAHRLRDLAFSNVEEENNQIAETTDIFNKLINREAHNLNIAKIKNLVINGEGYASTVENCLMIVNAIPEREYENFVEMNRKLDMKLKIIYDLLHIEDVSYSKNAIKVLSTNVECLANFTTLTGKLFLATYEISFTLFNIEKVIKEY